MAFALTDPKQNCPSNAPIRVPGIGGDWCHTREEWAAVTAPKKTSGFTFAKALPVLGGGVAGLGLGYLLFRK